VEIAHMRTVLEGCRWRVRGVGGAAERLGLKPSTLETRMAKLGIKRAEK
jgi:transcriptional regulator with GAF, ATPase, and Fis domain